MHYLEFAVGFAFLLAGVWFGYQTIQSLGTDSIWVDIDGKKVELVRGQEPSRFKSAIQFQASAALGSLAVGTFILTLKLTGVD